jgi:uncharacterized damage-inducible protein DinB
MHLTIDEMLAYTDEEREKWRCWFSAQGNDPLKIALNNQTHPSVGMLILHCFWAEVFYAYLMRDEILTLESEIVKQNKDLPPDDAEKLFAFGQLTRRQMRAFTQAATPEDWEGRHRFKDEHLEIQGTARKLIAHILIHEIRHLAQIAFTVRQHDLAPPGDHDLLFSASFGPLVKRA